LRPRGGPELAVPRVVLDRHPDTADRDAQPGREGAELLRALSERHPVFVAEV
jgi:hypothetical protein